jgi:apolipoprotein N-acyltransferase
MQRACAFAREHGVYFAPAVLTLEEGSTLSDNKIVMLHPDGPEAFSFVKVKSWYPTGSEGVLKPVETPYVTIGAAIYFDTDFPSFIDRFARMGADIVIAPAYDSALIRPFHTEVGLLRAVENGFSMVRQVNEGTSPAADTFGGAIARRRRVKYGRRATPRRRRASRPRAGGGACGAPASQSGGFAPW